jgi:hypothetical protein
VDVGFEKLKSDSFCGNRVFKMNIQFCCPIICAAVVLQFFETNLLNARRSLSVNVEFCPLFLLADVVFPRFIYANITFGTVALDTPKKVAVFTTDAPSKRTPAIRHFLKSEKAPIFLFFHTDCHSAQSLIH